jgi:hypothetical protein
MSVTDVGYVTACNVVLLGGFGSLRDLVAWCVQLRGPKRAVMNNPMQVKGAPKSFEQCVHLDSGR